MHPVAKFLVISFTIGLTAVGEFLLYFYNISVHLRPGPALGEGKGSVALYYVFLPVFQSIIRPTENLKF